MTKPITSCAKCGCQACRCNTQNEVINERSGYIEHNSHAAEAVLIEETGGMVSKDDVLAKLRQPIYFGDHFHSPDYRRGYTGSNKDAIAAIEAMPCRDDKLVEALAEKERMLQCVRMLYINMKRDSGKITPIMEPLLRDVLDGKEAREIVILAENLLKDKGAR